MKRLHIIAPTFDIVGPGRPLSAAQLEARKKGGQASGKGGERRVAGVGRARRRPSGQSPSSGVSKERRTASQEGHVGRRQIKVTPQIVPSSRVGMALKSR